MGANDSNARLIRFTALVAGHMLGALTEEQAAPLTSEAAILRLLAMRKLAGLDRPEDEAIWNEILFQIGNDNKNATRLTNEFGEQAGAKMFALREQAARGDTT